jgi:hypothetical protein
MAQSICLIGVLRSPLPQPWPWQRQQRDRTTTCQDFALREAKFPRRAVSVVPAPCGCRASKNSRLRSRPLSATIGRGKHKLQKKKQCRPPTQRAPQTPWRSTSALWRPPKLVAHLNQMHRVPQLCEATTHLGHRRRNRCQEQQRRHRCVGTSRKRTYQATA